MVRSSDIPVHESESTGGGLTRRSVLLLGTATAASVWLAANSAPGAASAEPIMNTTGHSGLTLSSKVPFSFRYRGASSRDFLNSWHRTVRTGPERNGARTTAVTWKDPATPLTVTWSSTEYRGYATTSWQLWFENTGNTTLSAVSDILAIDVSASRLHSGDWQIRTANGSAAQPTDFEPYSLPLAANTFRQFTTGGGRPTNGYRGTTEGSAIGGAWPYWNIDGGDVGLIASLGWPGQWATGIERVGDQQVTIRGGMANTSWFTPGQRVTDKQLNAIQLPKHEKIMTPLAVVQPWQGGDWIDAQNDWRRWFLAYNTPRVNGRAPAPLMPTQANDYFTGQTTTIDDELSFLNAYGAHHATAGTGGVHDHWWVDAGWYETPDDWPDPNTAWVPVGTWEVDHERFPNGLKPISDRAHQLGMKSIVWFEPERVMPGTWLYENHPEWLLQPAAGDPQFSGAARLLNFGNPDALAWAISHFGDLIESQGIDVYREDFNIDPLFFWNAADFPSGSSGRQFSGVQGQDNWHYQDYIGGQWQDMQTFSTSGYLGKPEWHDAAGGYVWPGGLHPGPDNDTALVWIAPQAGSIGVRSHVSKIDPSGDGVTVSIRVNDTVVWGPTVLAGADTSGVLANLDDVTVAAGDAVRFVINRSTAYNSDSTMWSPVIAYGDDIDDVVVQYGLAQARYVTGHLTFWQELRRRHAGLMIDNCASGGRRMDLLSLRESIVLLRSDWVLQYVGEQAATYGVSPWVPMTGTAARVTTSALDAYNSRSAMAPSFHLALDPRQADADWATLIRMSKEWKAVKDGYLGDFVPLTPYSVSESDQLAFQFAEQDGRAGFIQAFRRSANGSNSITVKPRGLAKLGVYEFRDLQSNQVVRRTGQQVAADGIVISLPSAPSATTVKYRRV